MQTEATPEEKLQKLVAVVKESKVKVNKVKFELEIQIMELQMRLQPTTPPKFCEQHEADIKATMENVATTFKDFIHIFKDTMEIWASL